MSFGTKSVFWIQRRQAVRKIEKHSRSVLNSALLPLMWVYFSRANGSNYLSNGRFSKLGLCFSLQEKKPFIYKRGFVNPQPFKMISPTTQTASNLQQIAAN